MKDISCLGTVAVVGGDARQQALYDYFKSLGAECSLFGFSACSHKTFSRFIERSDCIILPLPLTRDGHTINADGECLLIDAEDFAALLHPGQMVFAGLPCADMLRLFSSRGITLTDYYSDEALKIYNAELTAQGLLRVILENTERRLRDSRILITGYGRVGSATAKLLKSCGADVTACVRSSESAASAESDAIEAAYYSRLKDSLFSYDVIINTVASTVIDRDMLKSARKDTLLLEAASAPYGFDMAASANYGLDVKLCPGLPGKYTPVSAGRAIGDTVIRLATACKKQGQ